MRSTTHRGLAALLLPAALLAGPSRVAEAVLSVSMNAAAFPKTMPDATSVAMWGFGPGAAGAPTVPGPPIVVPAGETVLEVTLTNNLAVPVSLVILGQSAPTVGGSLPGPTWVDSAGTQTWTGSRPPAIRDARIRSFTQETPPGGTVVYTFSGLRPGTYLYESGTHQAVQVQMGLYGAMTLNAADAAAGPPAVPAQAYPGVSYDTEVVLLYSEIDPALHAAVAGSTYGTAAYPSTIGYEPEFFLVNGEPFAAGPPATPAVPAGSANGSTLLRLLNAGLGTHVPTLLGGTLGLVAEDGNPYPHARQQYSAPLPAGKTLDAVFTAPAAGEYPLFDRALALMSGTATDSGLRTVLAVGAALGPSAAADAYATGEDSALVVAAPGVLTNDDPGTTATLTAAPVHGTVTLQPTGGFTYTPAANFSGADSFAYRAALGTSQSAPTPVAITVTPVNDVPVAVADSYSATTGVPLVVGSSAATTPQGVLLNDSDADGDALATNLPGGPSGGTLTLALNGAFVFTAPAAGTYTFNYQATDGVATSPNALVTIVVANAVNAPPVAVGDLANTVRNGSVDINVLANDTDPNGPLPNAATSVVIVQAPRHGTATVLANGRVRYTNLNWRGTDSFTYRAKDPQNALSNTATVRVNVLR